MTTRAQIAMWFDQAKANGAEFLIVGVDAFAHTHYPIECKDAEAYRKRMAEFESDEDGDLSDWAIEVYDLTKDPEYQLNAFRSWNPPT